MENSGNKMAANSKAYWVDGVCLTYTGSLSWIPTPTPAMLSDYIRIVYNKKETGFPTVLYFRGEL